MGTGSASHHVDGGLGVDVGAVRKLLVDWVGTFVVVFMAVDPEVQTVFEEQRFEVFADLASVA